MNIWPLFLAIFLISITYLALKPGGFLDQYRDYRHGKAVDETLEWQSFTDAFKADK